MVNDISASLKTAERIAIGFFLFVMFLAIGYFIYLGWLTYTAEQKYAMSEDGQPDEAKEWEDLEGDYLPEETNATW